MFNNLNKSREQVIDSQETENKKLDLTSCDSKDFLKNICNRYYSLYCTNELILAKAKDLNKNKSEIENIVNYVLSLDKEQVIDLLPKQRYTSFDKLDPLLQDKTYVILCLIEFGINPFEIKKSLQNHLVWNQFLRTIESYKEEWCYAFYNNRRRFAVDISDSIFIVEFMNIFGKLLNSNENADPVDIDSAIYILNKEYLDKAILRFIWFYLNDTSSSNKPDMKKFLLGIPNGIIFKKFLDDKYKNKFKGQNELDLQNVITYVYWNNKFTNTDFQSDFYSWVEKLDPVMTGLFALILMRNISFTDEQMNFIAQKIKNNQVMTTLRQINQSLDYKNSGAHHWTYNEKDNCRRIQFGSMTHSLDYVFMKIFRGLGYLGSVLLLLLFILIYLSIIFGIAFAIAYGFVLGGSIAFLSASFWTYFFKCAVSLWIGSCVLMFATHCMPRFGDWWRDFPDEMQNFYNKSKIVRWLEYYNIKHPTNSIGHPPQFIDSGLRSSENMGQQSENKDSKSEVLLIDINNKHEIS